MKRRPIGSRGASVLAVILILTILTALGVIFSSLLSTSVEESTAQVLSTRALYTAEAGLEAAVGHLNKTPASVNWAWRDGYKNKAVGGGLTDVEVLQYEQRDSTLAAAYACERFESVIASTGANPARTVYALLSWSSAADLGLELYDNAVADCANPSASANLLASSMTTNMPERIRYTITAAAPATLTYTARITGTAGNAYSLRVTHPDESAFGTGTTCGAPAGPPFKACVRAIIALGRHGAARREVFAAMSRTP